MKANEFKLFWIVGILYEFQNMQFFLLYLYVQINFIKVILYSNTDSCIF